MRCRWCKREVPRREYSEHLEICEKHRKWLMKRLQA